MVEDVCFSMKGRIVFKMSKIDGEVSTFLKLNKRRGSNKLHRWGGFLKNNKNTATFIMVVRVRVFIIIYSVSRNYWTKPNFDYEGTIENRIVKRFESISLSNRILLFTSFKYMRLIVLLWDNICVFFSKKGS